MQQLATSIGTAIMTIVYFSILRSGGEAQAVVVSPIVVAAITALCLGLVRLLPRHRGPA